MIRIIPNCVSPLIFELDGDFASYAPYSVLGSGFLCQYKERYFFITAKHCLSSDSYNQLQIPEGIGQNSTLPFEKIAITRHPSSEDDTDCGDFVILSLPLNYTPKQQVGALQAVEIPIEDIDLDNLPKKTLITIKGYPIEAPETTIDTDRCVIKIQALIYDAILEGEAESKFCYKYTRCGKLGVEDTNGMSGSPVFLKFNDCYMLIGLKIRSLRFIHIKAIRFGIDKFLENN